MDKNLYLVKKVSQREGKEPFTYVQLICDLGYSKLVVSMDKNVIAELLGVSVAHLYEIEVDKPTFIGRLNVE